MAKTKAQPPITIDDGANRLSIRFYVSDDATGNVPRVTVYTPNGQGFDHAISEYSSLNNTQKTNLRTMLLAIRDETFTLEGYT